MGTYINPFIGIWMFISIIFQGVEQPRPNPDLKLEFVFLNQSELRTHYSRLNESGFCESLSMYSIESSNMQFSQGKLHTLVKWINPENSSACSQDPDMHEGRVGISDFMFIDGHLHLKLPLGDNQITMVWDRQGK